MKKAYKRKAKATWKTLLEVFPEQPEYGSQAWYDDQIEIVPDHDHDECSPWCVYIVCDLEYLKWEHETATQPLNG